MTTIVVDREMGYIAADRMSTSNDSEVAIECPKIHKLELPDGIHLIACAGAEGSSQIFENWYESGDWEDPIDALNEDDFTAIILTPDYDIWIADKFMCPYQLYPGLPHGKRRRRWYAAGTGGPFAWAVLWAGCGIDVAMETAIAMDPSSGYGFDIEYLESSSFG